MLRSRSSTNQQSAPLTTTFDDIVNEVREARSQHWTVKPNSNFAEELVSCSPHAGRPQRRRPGKFTPVSIPQHSRRSPAPVAPAPDVSNAGRWNASIVGTLTAMDMEGIRSRAWMPLLSMPRRQRGIPSTGVLTSAGRWQTASRRRLCCGIDNRGNFPGRRRWGPAAWRLHETSSSAKLLIGFLCPVL